MKKFLFIAIIAIIIAALGVGGWYFLLRDKKNDINAVITKNEKTETAPAKPEVDAGTLELLKKFADDQDRDGIKDEEEKAQGLNPNEFDSDFDGLSDKLEIEKWKTDPLKKDTDGDGFGDGKEIIRGYNPLGAGKLEE
ncbi:MAG: hypothetical protein A2921_02075 [Candidatus Magasanikbacteria bacterium RIFCSPLOWO2_01_FULL_43_20b]|uniref:Uncharacterized protein n=1 Tax=Candidatus Magasanikbacteria bacterium RIFCSPLOWO2_12_FULL_43_12 TaxID=1798692 RepID=A0A1F6MV67_9BACT|nr:MAG: hypothetical protein A3C74_02105 [Candidatus Magasanikbacteria bacterium RIFCSPHIGHO2_02_FULL_44_13]OGH71674.1 MAG: hypothetical protein A3I93_02175 [Candidatus Magasanikbacteria bacterium RIFCSPLOWO2_02_FULL_43_22]OGH73678.1 MAG: hypothetical protein A2921_02075 [Candidatus Magasanikbacteria bacterium RIFCSPLOWO2_01_FULL_43_20b]OGH75512.1 MAG: hypothetical protein A3G00_00805 [Candidatus Magasanikbacteria bacterium RIFCSPLOWO2_12_FULL_43_12]